MTASLPDPPPLPARHAPAVDAGALLRELAFGGALIAVIVLVNGWIVLSEVRHHQLDFRMINHISAISASLERIAKLEASGSGAGDLLARLREDLAAFHARTEAEFGGNLPSTYHRALEVIDEQVREVASAIDRYRASPSVVSLHHLLDRSEAAWQRLDALLAETGLDADDNERRLKLLVPVIGVNIAIVTLVILRMHYYVRGRVAAQTSHDGLTGVLNRRMFQQVMRKETSRALRYDRPVSLLLLDVDDMKAVNDVYGPDHGDRLLREIGSRMSTNVRASDDVFRIDGQQFALIASETDLERATDLAEKLRRTVAAIELADGDSVSVSIGVAQYHRGEPPERLLGRAESAMVQAKRLGKDRVEVVVAPA